MNDMGRIILNSAKAIGYARLPMPTAARHDAAIGFGVSAWQKVAEWASRPNAGVEEVGKVIDAIDAEYRRQTAGLISADLGGPEREAERER